MNAMQALAITADSFAKLEVRTAQSFISISFNNLQCIRTDLYIWTYPPMYLLVLLAFLSTLSLYHGSSIGLPVKTMFQ